MHRLLIYIFIGWMYEPIKFFSFLAFVIHGTWYICHIYIRRKIHTIMMSTMKIYKRWGAILNRVRIWLYLYPYEYMTIPILLWVYDYTLMGILLYLYPYGYTTIPIPLWVYYLGVSKSSGSDNLFFYSTL
jgi:hypothetical protein